MRFISLIIVILMATPVKAQREINCDATGAAERDSEITLIKRLDDFERGLREAGLPKEQFDRLLRDGKIVLIKNYRLQLELEGFCDRERDRRKRR